MTTPLIVTKIFLSYYKLQMLKSKKYTVVSLKESLFQNSQEVSVSEAHFQGGANGKEPACQCRRCRRSGFDPGSGRSPGGGHGNPLQYSCLENHRDREAWQPTVHGVAKSWTGLK